MLTRYRYTLQPYTGPTSRYTCPSCDKTRAFTRYLDTRTGELLEAKFGKCDRNDKCGYHLSPYHPSSGVDGLSYKDQVYLERKAGATQSATLQRLYTTTAKAGSKPVEPAFLISIEPVSIEPAVIPLELLQTTLCRYSKNNLEQFRSRYTDF